MDARLLSSRSASSRDYDIYVITAEGKNLKQLTLEGTNRMPAYSPDGRKIAFASSREGDFNIYLMDSNARNVVKLTRTPPGTENISPSWLPSPLAVIPKRKVADILGRSQTNRQPVMMSMNLATYTNVETSIPVVLILQHLLLLPKVTKSQSGAGRRNSRLISDDSRDCLLN